MRRFPALFLVFLIVTLVVGIYAMSNFVTVPSKGKIKAVNVGIYEDSDCSNQLTEIDWGMLEPSDVRNEIAYIQNEANVPINLSLMTEGWDPQIASSVIDLGWDYDGSVIAVDGVVEVVFSLTVSPQISNVTSFSFNIVIVGEG